MIDYYLVQNKVPAGSKDYHAVVTHTEGLNQDNFVKMLAEVLNVNEGEAKKVITGIGTAAKNLFSQGWNFKIEDLGTFSLSITGSFAGPDAPFNHESNKIAVRFQADKDLTAAAQSASLNRLHGVEHGPVIDSVEDKSSGAIDSKLTPGHGVQVIGKDIKIAGTDSAVGIHLIDQSGVMTGVPSGDILENGPTKLVFICPALSAGDYTLQISTQYSKGKELTYPRSYVFNAPLTVSA
jgi:nucleoid DNA-binding protein